jgi:hypothetical protein
MLNGDFTSTPAASQAVIAGGQKYATIPVPVLAISARYLVICLISTTVRGCARHSTRTMKPSRGRRPQHLKKACLFSRVIRLQHANHYVFRSNEADVLRQMKAFIDGLAK